MSSFISSPYKTPTKSRNKSDLSLSDLSTPSRYSGVDSKHDQILDKIYETKEDIKILSAKTDAYAKNSSLIYSNYYSIISKIECYIEKKNSKIVIINLSFQNFVFVFVFQ